MSGNRNESPPSRRRGYLRIPALCVYNCVYVYICALLCVCAGVGLITSGSRRGLGGGASGSDVAGAAGVPVSSVATWAVPARVCVYRGCRVCVCVSCVSRVVGCGGTARCVCMWRVCLGLGVTGQSVLAVRHVSGAGGGVVVAMNRGRMYIAMGGSELAGRLMSRAVVAGKAPPPPNHAGTPPCHRRPSSPAPPALLYTCDLPPHTRVSLLCTR